VIFARAGIDLDEAFARLRVYARSHNTHLTDVAQAEGATWSRDLYALDE
jgi:AmiR/NasT family two-component response regulator